MVNAVSLFKADLPESLDDLNELVRVTSTPTPVEKPLPGDQTRLDPKSKTMPRGQIPALHQNFNATAIQFDGAVKPLLSQTPVVVAAPEEIVAVRAYNGQLPEFKGQQLYTLGRFQLEGNRELGIVFASRPDGSRVFFVADLGDDKPMSEDEFKQWYMQQVQTQLEKVRLAQSRFQGIDLDNQSYQQSAVESVAKEKAMLDQAQIQVQQRVVELKKQGVTPDRIAQEVRQITAVAVQNAQLASGAAMMRLKTELTNDMAHLRENVHSETLNTMVESGRRADQSYQKYLVATNQPIEAQVLQVGAVAGKAAGQTEQDLPPMAAAGVTAPEQEPLAPRASPADDKREVKIEVQGATLLGKRQANDSEEADSELEKRRQEQADNTRQQQVRRSQEQTARQHAERMREFHRRVQKEKEGEKSEEMLTMLRISHASRRFEGRFSSLAEKNFLELIDSPLVRQPGEDHRKA